MYAIRSYYAIGILVSSGQKVKVASSVTFGFSRTVISTSVITSYSIHYTKLYDAKSLKQDGILSLSGGKISSMLSVGIVGRLFSLFSKKKIGMIMHRANQNNEDLIELFNQEKLKVVIDEKFPFEKLPDALLKQGEGRLKGKLVVQV